MARKRVRRFWSDNEKQMICSQTRAPGVSVAQVARRYSLNANLLFRWLKEPQFQQDTQNIDTVTFLPVEITAETEVALPARPHPTSVQAPYAGSRIEIATADGHRLTVEGGFDGEAMAHLLKGLMS